MQMDKWTDSRQTDRIKLIAAFCNFENVPKNECIRGSCICFISETTQEVLLLSEFRITGV